MTQTARGVMFFLCFSLCSCLLISDARGQAITISEELVLRNDYAYTILGWVKNDLLLFRDKGHSFFIQSFDEDLHLKWERQILLGDSRADIIGILAQDDLFHILYGMREKGDYYVHHISFDKDVNVVDTATLALYANAFIVPRIQMRVSEDKNKILLFDKDNSGLHLYSYDLNTLEVAWRKSIVLDGADLVEDFRAMEVTNEGEFFLSLKSDKPQQKIQYLHIFFSVPGVEQVIHDTIRLGDLAVFDVYPVYDPIQKCLVISGMYGDRNTNRAKGFYFIRYFDMMRHELTYLPFDESLLTEVSGRETSASRGLSDFKVQQVALRHDGGAVIIAELIKEFSRRSSLPMQRDNGTYGRDGWIDYYFEDMILFAVNPDGTPHWSEVLRKRQYSQDDGAMYSSFLLFKTPERLRFLFNDEIKQENTVGGYEVNGKGYTERKTIFNTDYQRLKLRFRDGLQLSNDECIVPSERNNRLSLVRIKFQE